MPANLQSHDSELPLKRVGIRDEPWFDRISPYPYLFIGIPIYAISVLRIVTAITDQRNSRERLVETETVSRNGAAEPLTKCRESVLQKERQGPMSERFSIGARIRELRCVHSMSMQVLAGESGISQGHLSDIEAGKALNPSIATAQAIASAFGLTVSELLLEDKPRNEDDERLAMLNRWYADELDSFGREAVLLIAEHHRRRSA